MKGLLRERRARNVDRAALAYAGGGWLLAQGHADIPFALVAAGRVAEARVELDRLLALARERYVPAYDIAVIFAALGDCEASFDWLDKAVEGAFVPVDPALASLRSDARFKALLARLQVRSPT